MQSLFKIFPITHNIERDLVAVRFFQHPGNYKDYKSSVSGDGVKDQIFMYSLFLYVEIILDLQKSQKKIV